MIQKEGRKRNVRHSKGFKNLVNGQATQAEDYRRPHRKQLMETIFRTDINRRIHETERTIEVVSVLPELEYLSQPGVDLAVGIDLRTRRQTNNALVSAIDQTVLPHSDMYMIRQPIKIPPNYKKRLESLQRIGEKFRTEKERYEKNRKMMDEAVIKLRFAPPPEKIPSEPPTESSIDLQAVMEEENKSAASESIPPTPSSVRNFFDRKSEFERSGLPSITDSNENLIESDKLPTQSLISHLPRNSSTVGQSLTTQPSFLTMPSRQSRLQSSSSGLSAANEGQNAEAAAENWQARNVPYMLAIWGKAEGIDVEKYIPKRRISLKKAESKMSVIRGESKRFSTGNTTFWRKPSANIELLMENAKSQTKYQGDSTDVIAEGGILQEAGLRASVKEQKSYKRLPTTISEGTFELLKRFSRDTVSDEPQLEVVSDETVVKRVLTGFGVKGLTELNSHEDFDAIASENSTNNVEKRRHSSPFKNVTPGNCSKVIGEFITDEGDLKIPTSLGESHKDSFRFRLPDIQTDEVDQNNQPKEHKQIAIVDENNVDGIYDQMFENLQHLFGKDVHMPKRIKSNPNEIFTPINLGVETGEPILEYTTNNEIHLKKFNMALKNNIMTGCCSPENKLMWNSYLDSPIAKLFDIPQKTSREWNELQKIAISGIKQETDRALLGEAICVLIQLGGESALGRWDTIIFKQFINELMEIGNCEQKQIVSLYYVKQSKVDKRVVDQIYLGLGDLNQEKRMQTLSILGSLDIGFAEYIVHLCKRDVAHSNWRVRLDVIHLLAAWTKRLAPSDNGPPPKRDPDALETDDEKTVKALFYTLGTTTLEQHEEQAERSSMPQFIQMDDESLPKANEEANAELFAECVQILLGLMWNDWSENVRDVANSVLGKLHQGKPVYDWILLQLEKPDPVKRVDALKSLTAIGVLFKHNINTFLKCFKDPYASVRIAACKVRVILNQVACVLESPEREIVTEIMGMLDDHNYKVRAYAVKALGLSKFKGAKIRQSLNWALQHDDHPAVRAEAIRAAYNLGIIQEDSSIKDGVLTLLATDKAEKVQKEAERVLALSNVIFPSIKGDDKEKPEGRVKVDGTLVSPYPHILGDKSAEEVAIYLSTSLIGDHEINSVINKVRLMSTKEAMMSKVDEIGGKFKHVKVQGLDLKYDSDHKPMLAGAVATRTSLRKRMEAKGVAPNTNGVPEIKSNSPIKS
ncbi:HEAT repeat-containing protein 4 [Terramyces sp. JEL0728]|nr:HEAT repeat-containing protein 4 [Terramyces sp. JEL0728]